jgi:TldD protein
MSSNATELDRELKAFGIPALGAAAVEKVLRTALRHGGSLSELFFEDTSATRVMFEGGRLDKVVDGRDRGVGLRIIFANKSVYGYTTDLNERALLALAEALSEAVSDPAGAKRATQSIEWGKARQPSSEIAGYRIGQSPRAAPLAKKIDLVRRADQAARSALPGRVRQVSAVVIDTLRNTLIVNSDGLIAPVSKTYFSMVAEVVGEKDGRVESAHEVEGGFVGLEFLDKVSPESIGEKAARRVGILLDAKPAPAGTMPVVIAAEAGGTMIHEAVGHGLEADLACNGLSVYQGKVGKQVASPLITVLDDGTMAAKRGSYAFDDEGTPSQKNTLIENGVLKGYLVDRLSAMKFDFMATGNGRRESFRHKPIVRMTNTYIAPGKDDPKKILAETEMGVFVKAMGGGQVNTVTGDFVFAVTEGYLIENGKLGAPIRGATLVGNGPKVLSIVDRVGSDLGFSNGTCGKDGQGAPVTDAQPTIRIPELTVGGETPMTTYWPGKKAAGAK